MSSLVPETAPLNPPPPPRSNTPLPPHSHQDTDMSDARSPLDPAPMDMDDHTLRSQAELDAMNEEPMDEDAPQPGREWWRDAKDVAHERLINRAKRVWIALAHR